MKIFTGPQIREADRYTIENEPVESIELMERAAEAIAGAIARRTEQHRTLLFFIGKGNNGGDGLAVARILSNAGFDCGVHMLYGPEELSPDCRFNYDRLPSDVACITDVPEYAPDKETVVIDAVFGTGLKGPVEEARAAGAIKLINGLPCEVISIDIPSGMRPEFGNGGQLIVEADLTLTIQFPKLAMLLPEAGEHCGEIEILPIDLHPEYLETAATSYNYIDPDLIKNFIKVRSKFSHKGSYGHAIIVCGSKNMCGAAILAAGGALRSGCGLVTVHMPESCSQALFASAPSAILSGDPGNGFSVVPENPERFDSCGAGPGIGQGSETAKALGSLMEAYKKPMVLDADALNIIADDPNMKKLIPPHSILTPHPGELARLVGKWRDDEEKISLTRGLAKEINSIVVVKGAYTMACMPDGNLWFNSTGSPGMAKGGSGDVLTGFITGLLARGYAPHEAAILGVYAHGLAGEKAAGYYGAEGMNSSDITDFLGEALVEIE